MSTPSPLNDIHDFIRQLLSSIAAAGLYGMAHEQVQRLIAGAHRSLSRALSIRPDIALLEVEGELIIDNQPQPLSLVLDRFTRHLREQGIGHLRFVGPVPLAELEQFIAELTRQADGVQLGSGEHIRVGRVELPEHGSADGSLGADGNAGTRLEYDLSKLPALELERLTEVYEAVRRKERLKPSGIAATVAELVEAFNREGEALLVLAALRKKDEYTFTHVANVCILTLAQAQSLGITGQLLNDIGMAAMLHDMGKMFIPDEILNKPGKLTEEEFEIMKSHPARGARYLLDTPGVPRLSPVVAYEHHMRYDLSGYPAVPSGWQLNLASQMTAISDIFDAMRTRRPYKEPLEPEIILDLLATKAGSEFNPYLVKNMMELMARINQI